MGFIKIKSVYVLLFVFLIFLAAPAVTQCFAAGRPAPESNSGGGDQDVMTAEDKEERDRLFGKREIPKLGAGKWEPLFEMGESIYPSVVISTATMKEGLWDEREHMGDPWGVIGVAVRGTGKACPVTVEISGSSFIKPSSISVKLPDGNTVYRVYPDIKYDYEKLLAVKQTVPEMLSFTVTIGGAGGTEKTVKVQVRPVNECVFNFVDSSGDAYDVSFLFAAYVNENHPVVSQIMKEAIAAGRVNSFTGYSDDSQSVISEIEAVWNTLKKRGLHYSTMTASADDDNPYIGTQYVRLLGESVNYAQANCVDGSVLMASVFRKMGLDVSLIELPSHMFIAVNLDEDGKETAFIETTMLSDSTLEEAMEEGNEQYEESKNKFDSDKPEGEAYNIVNIQNARIMGIMPIKDSSAN